MAFRPSHINREQIPASVRIAAQRSHIGAHFPSTDSHHFPTPYAYLPATAPGVTANPTFRPIFDLMPPFTSSPLPNTNHPRTLATSVDMPSIRRTTSQRPAQNVLYRPEPTAGPSRMAPNLYASAGYTNQPEPSPSSFAAPELIAPSAALPTRRRGSQPRPGPPSAASDTHSHTLTAGSTGTAPPRRKRARTSESYDVDEEEEESNGVNDGSDGLLASKACLRCNRDKVKCRYPLGSSSCKRCQEKRLECRAREVKLSAAAGRKKYVEAQLKEKDAIIESLLKELYNPYRAHPLSVRTMDEISPPATGEAPELQELRERVVSSADQAGDVAIFAYQCSPGADEAANGQQTGASSACSPGGHSSTSECSRDSGSLDDAAPIEMLAKMSLEDRADAEAEEGSNSSASSTAADDQPGPANAGYFKPGAGIDLRLRSKMELEYRTSPLISHKLMTEEDVQELFKIFHANLNAFVPLLDPVIHTPQQTYARCPALFSVVCAVSSRYYKIKSHMYPIMMHIARNEASTAVMNGWKSIELAQAFILLALWAPPAKKWEEERGYLYTGIATRLAIDLNAHLCPAEPAKTEEEDRERLNKRRLWMICFETDWAMAAHYGKPAAVRENQIIRISDDFYHCSAFNNNLVGDIGLSAYNKLLRLTAEFHMEVYSDPDSRTGLRRELDFSIVVEKYSKKLDELQREWEEKFAAHTDFQDDPVFRLRCTLLPYVVEYKRLLMQSFEFQQALERGLQFTDRGIIERCIESATRVLRTFIYDLVPGGYPLYAPNGWINYGAFAAAFLCKLLRPKFSELIIFEERQEIIQLIETLMQTLRSRDVAVDDRHTPRLWARFFEQVLAKLDRAPPVQASPTEFVGSSSPVDWTHSTQPYQNADPGYYAYNPSQYQAYQMWSQPTALSYWVASQQNLQYQAMGGSFTHGTMGSDGSDHSYTMPDPNSLGSDNVMMPGYQWNLSSYEDPYAANYGYQTSTQ